MGMTSRQILLKVRLPLSLDVIMAGVRTALTINIGTATLAAFIGAGGLGESIITGISLNNNELILRGAIPAAVLALVADQGMALIEKAVSPRKGGNK
jgi:osmoprotectant transport system permease protein